MCIIMFIQAQLVHFMLKGRVIMSIGEKLKKLRGDKTQEEISRELGITKSSYAMYERNERVPRDEVKVQISNFFGISVQELFFSCNEHI